jgi:hypothetical protein
VATFVLLHSPAVGPATWQPVARRLRQAGQGTVVPSLVTVGAGAPPYWPRIVAAVAASLAGVPDDHQLVLVAHSNASIFVPVLVDVLARPVACCLFADAGVPVSSGAMPVIGADFLPFLRGLADADGRLPPWTEWWSELDVAALFPDELTRQMISAEQPRLPLRYFLEQVPVPAGWDDRRCGYLLFSQAYEGAADQARARGWPVRTARGEHLHQVVDPDVVSRALLDLAGTARLGAK